MYQQARRWLAAGVFEVLAHDLREVIRVAAGLPAPVSVNGIGQRPIEGVSMAYTWDRATATSSPRTPTGT